MLSFPSVPGLALIVLVWAGAWMVSRFLPECLEIRVRSSMRGDFIQSLVPALSPPWFWLFFFFFPQSWSGKDPAFWGVRRSALALAVFLPSIQLEEQRRGSSAKFVPATNYDCRAVKSNIKLLRLALFIWIQSKDQFNILMESCHHIRRTLLPVSWYSSLHFESLLAHT